MTGMGNIENAREKYERAQACLNSIAPELASGFPDPSKIAQPEARSTPRKQRKAKRRGALEGTVFLRKSDGRWVASVNVGWRGARRRRLYAYCATQADAIKALATLRQRHEHGLSADSANLTLSEYAKCWIAGLDVKPRTSASYKWLLDSYVLPALGAYKLSAVRARDVRRLLGELRSRGYAKNTVRLARAALSALFSDAVDDELVAANPAFVRTRRRRSNGMSAEDRIKSIRPFTEEELGAFLEAARADRLYHPFFLTLARTGMRPGEAYALRWSDLDFEHREILIERALSAGRIGTPKTGRTRRVDISLELAETLRRLRRERERDALASGRVELSELVFMNAAGNNLDESRIRKRFLATMRRAKLSGHRLYDLRHSFASIHLAKGTPVTYVAAQLGHEKPVTTLQWYARWLPRADKRFADALDGRLTEGEKTAVQPPWLSIRLSEERRPAFDVASAMNKR